jgi:hypothetical protein
MKREAPFVLLKCLSKDGSDVDVAVIELSRDLINTIKIGLSELQILKLGGSEVVSVKYYDYSPELWKADWDSEEVHDESGEEIYPPDFSSEENFTKKDECYLHICDSYFYWRAYPKYADYDVETTTVHYERLSEWEQKLSEWEQKKVSEAAL